MTVAENHFQEDLEYDLLGEDPSISEEGSAANHARRTSPAFTGEALALLGSPVLPQRALYGRLISQYANNGPITPRIPKVYINSNTPFSAVVCGVQGSGKSHSTAVLLESCLMTDERIGTLPEPLSALVFHFDTAAGGGQVQPCEAAYLSALNPKLPAGGATPPNVTVLVVPSYLQAMRRVYAGLPAVTVEPLLFAPGDISGERLLAMMKVDESAQMPLYMESIMMILRSMQDNFDYATFRQALDKQAFNKSQLAMLRLRLALLDSCLEGGDDTNSVVSHFRQGQLTIIDLSSPFMDGSSACGFFDMILGLFVEADIDASGKIVVLDEAHKYLSESQTGSSARLTDSLLTVVRQQRHLATRVVISTQEPTVVPSKFLALCSIIIAHRFSSPTWLKELGKHVSAAHSSTEELFSKIIALPTGQAVMFSANALCVERSEEAPDSVTVLGQGYFLVRSRLRITRDGGHSLLAVADPEITTRIQRVSTRGVEEATAPFDEDASEARTGFQAQYDTSSYNGAAAPAPNADPYANDPGPVNTTQTQTEYPPWFIPPMVAAAARRARPAMQTPAPMPEPTNTVHVSAQYTPMIRYLLDCKQRGQYCLTISDIWRHFRNTQPTLYGDKRKHFTNLLGAMAQLGLIVGLLSHAGKPAYSLLPDVSYVS